jgi:hypothetical protein
MQNNNLKKFMIIQKGFLLIRIVATMIITAVIIKIYL